MRLSSLNLSPLKNSCQHTICQCLKFVNEHAFNLHLAYVSCLFHGLFLVPVADRVSSLCFNILPKGILGYNNL
jgi:hypothetical protein